MPNDDNAQQQYESATDKPRLYDVVAIAARSYSNQPHAVRGLPQICKAYKNSTHIRETRHQKTGLNSDQFEKLMHHYDNDPANNFARIWVNDEDVDREIEDWRKNRPALLGMALEEEGMDSFRDRMKADMQIESVFLAMECMFDGYVPDPADKHYQLWKEFYKNKASAIEEIIDEQYSQEVVCEVDEESIMYNERIYDQYNKRIANHRKSVTEFDNRLLLAENNMRRQVWVSAAAARATRRTPIRARRASAGHGATAKAGDDGDGGDDGEPHRPRPTARVPAPQLYLLNNLTTHPLIAGGAQ